MNTCDAGAAAACQTSILGGTAQTNGERRKQDVEADCERELDAREQYGVVQQSVH